MLIRGLDTGLWKCQLLLVVGLLFCEIAFGQSCGTQFTNTGIESIKAQKIFYKGGKSNESKKGLKLSHNTLEIDLKGDERYPEIDSTGFDISDVCEIDNYLPIIQSVVCVSKSFDPTEEGGSDDRFGKFFAIKTSNGHTAPCKDIVLNILDHEHPAGKISLTIRITLKPFEGGNLRSFYELKLIVHVPSGLKAVALPNTDRVVTTASPVQPKDTVRSTLPPAHTPAQKPNSKPKKPVKGRTAMKALDGPIAAKALDRMIDQSNATKPTVQEPAVPKVGANFHPVEKAKEEQHYFLIGGLWFLSLCFVVWILLRLQQSRQKELMMLDEMGQEGAEMPEDNALGASPILVIKKAIQPRTGKEYQPLAEKMDWRMEVGGEEFSFPDKARWESSKVERLLLTAAVKAEMIALVRLSQAEIEARDMAEIGCFLLGEVSQGDHGYVVRVTDTVAIIAAYNDTFQLRFGPEAWDAVEDAKKAKGLMLVGWMHTHPGHHIFLSDYDVTLHRQDFPEEYAVALVIDPTLPGLPIGAFCWLAGNQMCNTKGMYREDAEVEGKIQFLEPDRRPWDASAVPTKQLLGEGNEEDQIISDTRQSRDF